MADRSLHESYQQQQQPGGNGGGRVVQPPVALTRSLPSYNELVSRRRQQAAQLETQLEGATALLPPDEEDDGYPTSNNPFDEVVIGGYENITYEPSLFHLSLF